MSFAVHLIAGEQAIIRNGIRNILSGLEVRNIQEADSVRELTRFIRNMQPAFVIVTAPMFAALPEAFRENASNRYLIVCDGGNLSLFSLVREEEAQGIILSSAGLEEWRFAVSRVLKGEKYISTDLFLRVNPFHSMRQQDHSIRLTPREKKILQLVAEGFTNKQIADRIFASQRTVEAHRTRLIGKTGAKNTATLVKMAVQKGLVD